VVGGSYRYVRNPMYLAVTAAIAGQAFLFGQLSLLWYAAIFLVVTATFVHFYEEPKPGAAVPGRLSDVREERARMVASATPVGGAALNRPVSQTDPRWDTQRGIPAGLGTEPNRAERSLALGAQRRLI